MERWAGRVALVTGASSGVGAAVAESLVKHGMIVFGCARNVIPIQASAEILGKFSGSLHAIQCDLRNEEQILSMFSEINEKYGGLDVCINNAGLGKMASLVDGKTDYWKEMLEVNVLALSICTREAIASMKKKGAEDGHVINVNSISGHVSSTTSANHWYVATKFMVTSLTENLRIELRETGSRVRATQICPGLVDTEFMKKMKGEIGARRYLEKEKLTVEQVAGAIVYTLSAEPNMEVNDVIFRPTSAPI